MTVLKRPGSWEEAKKQLGDANFMSKLLNYDKVGATHRLYNAASQGPWPIAKEVMQAGCAQSLPTSHPIPVGRHEQQQASVAEVILCTWQPLCHS